ncbi:uncharacterized protein LOC122304609 [Carya illinoinensis]|uniref:uncharacterized protein LOC122304609 n=1 Tax=Carya illinoinensis TaxID=32201 RepID=UPI001C721181|nr:uncharacterized protein LOC122304609 [Carya illinoinensis]
MGHHRFLPLGHIWRKKKSIFNGSTEHRGRPPQQLSGEDILNQLQNIPDIDFGKSTKKRKRTTDELNWTKRSIFFQLPYWSTLKLRHNLDVMHIEKNICDNILGTLMNIARKTKDHVNARRDLSNLNIKKELHLIQDGQRVSMPHACYTLYGAERAGFCKWLNDVKFPDGFASNIARCVSVVDCKISGMKSHDCHIFMQRLLPVAICGYLRQDIRLALTELSTYFKELCARTIKVDVLEWLQSDIAVILCKLEMIFPPTFFDVMVYLAYHLPHEALLAGPVQYRWMYPFERYLGKFKRYVKNKARPEGSIAEACIHVECLNFCSMYLHDVESRFNPQEWNFDGGEDGVGEGLSIFRQKRDRTIPEIQNLRVNNPGDVSDDLYALACGPDPWVVSYSGCIMNGIRFHTRQREAHRRTQNSGVLVISELDAQSVDFYGVLTNILEVRYMGWRRVYLFKCDWFDISDSRRGIRVDDHLTSVNMSLTFYKDEPFVLACQASQVFYLKNRMIPGNWYAVQKVVNRNVYDLPLRNLIEEDAYDASDVEAYQEDDSFEEYILVHADDNGLVNPMHRLDVEPTQIDASLVMEAENHNLDVRTFINDDSSESSSPYNTKHEGSTEEDSLSTDEEAN